MQVEGVRERDEEVVLNITFFGTNTMRKPFNPAYIFQYASM